MHRCFGCMREYDAANTFCPYCGYVQGTPVNSITHLLPGTMLQGHYV